MSLIVYAGPPPHSSPDAPVNSLISILLSAQPRKVEGILSVSRINVIMIGRACYVPQIFPAAVSCFNLSVLFCLIF